VTFNIHNGELKWLTDTNGRPYSCAPWQAQITFDNMCVDIFPQSPPPPPWCEFSFVLPVLHSLGWQACHMSLTTTCASTSSRSRHRRRPSTRSCLLQFLDKEVELGLRVPAQRHYILLASCVVNAACSDGWVYCVALSRYMFCEQRSVPCSCEVCSDLCSGLSSLRICSLYAFTCRPPPSSPPPPPNPPKYAYGFRICVMLLLFTCQS